MTTENAMDRTPVELRGNRQPRVLVTIHYPLDMRVVAEVLKAVAAGYPEAVVLETGEVLEYRVPS